MIRSLIKLGVLLVIGLLVYNYFLGTPEEKAQTQQVLDKGKEVLVSVGDLLKSEKDKFDAGKYDDALDKVGTAFDNIRDKAEEFADRDYLNRLEALDDKRIELQEELEEIETDSRDEFTTKGDERKAEEIKVEIDRLVDNAKRLVNDLERKAE